MAFDNLYLMARAQEVLEPDVVEGGFEMVISFGRFRLRRRLSLHCLISGACRSKAMPWISFQ